MDALRLANGGHVIPLPLHDGTLVLAHIGHHGDVLALTRYVRTPAGEKRYGLPIGSPISGSGGKAKAGKVVRGADHVKAAQKRADTRRAKVTAATDKVADLGARDRRKVLAGMPTAQLHTLNKELGRRTSDDGEAHPAKADVVNALAKTRQAEIRGLDDGKLDARMNDAIGKGDMDWFDVLGREADRRDKAATAKERRTGQAQAKRDAAEQAKAEHYEQLLTGGYDDEEAVEKAYGVPVEKQRAQAALASLRQAGYPGKGLREAAKAAFRDDVYERHIAAEDATNGHMLSKAGKAKGIDPITLHTGNEATARKYASPELLEWWDENGRTTFDEYVASLTGDQQSANRMRAERSDFHQ